MRKLLGSAVVVLTACVTPPQTPEEVRQGVERGAALTQKQEYEIKRPFERVFKDVKAHADRCLNVTVTGSTPTPYGPMQESVRYRSRSNKLNGTKGVTLLQQDARATGKMPEEGYFVMVNDVDRVAARRTRLTMYGPSIGYDNVFEAIHDWARGRKRECPRFPMGARGQRVTYH